MRPRINLAWPALVAFLCLASCTSFESEYEKGVYDYEPLYCYQTLGGVDCHRKPHHRDATRLVNYTVRPRASTNHRNRRKKARCGLRPR